MLTQETIDMVAVGLPLATPQVEQPNLPLSITISSGITLAVTGFAAKWMFGQIINYWQQQIQDLKKNFEKLDADIAALSTKDEEIRLDLSRLKVDIAQEYVTREDWIRSSVGLENKIERLGLRIDDKFDRLMERLPLYTDWDRN
jgi:hypothetical protein